MTVVITPNQDKILFIEIYYTVKAKVIYQKSGKIVKSTEVSTGGPNFKITLLSCREHVEKESRWQAVKRMSYHYKGGRMEVALKSHKFG